MVQTLGAMIRATRLSYGMTVAELARRTQLSAVALSAIEHGRVALPNFAVVASIAQALKVSLDTFAEADMPLPSRKKSARTPRTRKAKDTVTDTVTDTEIVTDTVTVTAPSMEPFDTTRYYLGKLCPKGHVFGGTGQSLLRTHNQRCRACENEAKRVRYHAKRQEVSA